MTAQLITSITVVLDDGRVFASTETKRVELSWVRPDRDAGTFDVAYKLEPSNPPGKLILLNDLERIDN